MEIQTRIPAFLWESLQDTLYQHDYQFLRDISPILGIPLADLKRTVLGTRGVKTTVAVLGQSDQWWEGQMCSYWVKSPLGVWKPCGEFREAHGGCCQHKHVPKSSSLHIRHREDPYLKTLPRLLPKKWKGEVVWVSPSNEVFYEDGTPILGFTICSTSGIVLSLPSSEDNP